MPCGALGKRLTYALSQVRTEGLLCLSSNPERSPLAVGRASWLGCGSPRLWVVPEASVVCGLGQLGQKGSCSDLEKILEHQVTKRPECILPFSGWSLFLASLYHFGSWRDLAACLLGLGGDGSGPLGQR